MSQNQPSRPKTNGRKRSPSEADAVFGNSSYLSGVSYNAASKTLTVDLKNGASYSYFPVGEDVFQQIQQAPSPGSFYAKAIKGKYQNTAVYKPLMPSDVPKTRSK